MGNKKFSSQIGTKIVSEFYANFSHIYNFLLIFKSFNFNSFQISEDLRFTPTQYSPQQRGTGVSKEGGKEVGGQGEERNPYEVSGWNTKMSVEPLHA